MTNERQSQPSENATPTLSGRESVREEVLRLHYRGWRTADIALVLDLSRNQVDEWIHEATKSGFVPLPRTPTGESTP